MNTGSEIAIIGIAGRFPGAANVQEFWHNLKNGVESIHFFTAEELRDAGVESNLLEDPLYIRANAFLEDKEFFDASFFGYLPSEANLIDPQIRLFHEECWKALEDAGYGIPGKGNRIGLFAGAASNVNWEVYATLSNMNEQVDQFTASQLRNARYLSTRISYALNLSGPSVFIDTACSTSLVAVHQACNSLLLGECSMALAGGVSLGYNSRTGYLYQEGMINSKDGHCRAFDENASGTIIGEGVAVVVLKKLKDAVKDKDHIYAVIKASCINNDGNDKVGYTAPSIDGQATVIKTAQNWAKTPVESISYVEAHGTGTPLGDPVEIAGLTRAFNTDKRQFCAIGSVKTNIGHLDAAAGVAGLIKTVMALKHRQLPPSLHFSNPNPKIDFANSPFYVNTELREWKNDLYPLRAGVSSFGIGGTNAHVIVEEPPVRDITPGREDYQLLVFSAKTPWSLAGNISNFCSYLKSNKQEDLADIAYTLQTGRSHFNYRQAIVCSNHDEAIDLLTVLQQSAEFANNIIPKQAPLIVFMFSGQGSQYAGMCRDLYQKETVFRNEVDYCCRLVKEMYNKDMLAAIFAEDEKDLLIIDNTEYTQPALFIIEYALAQLLMSRGINPDIMIGHSIGEYTAACIAGVFSLEDALCLVIKRGELMQKLAPGKMVSISASEEELAVLLSRFPRVSLAAVNSPGLCTVSGKGEWIEIFKKEAEEAGFVCRPVRTSHAFHSNMMDEILGEFRQVVASVKMIEPGIPYISNLTGKEASQDVVQPDYWIKHLRDTVQFSSGIEHLLHKKRECVFIEVGPGRVLSSLVLSHKNVQTDHTVVNLVKHVKETGNDVCHLLHAFAVLWNTGVRFKWEHFFEGAQCNKVSLPTYEFERTKYITDVDAARLLFSEQLRSGYKRSINESIHVSSWQPSLLPNKAIDLYADRAAFVIVSGKEKLSKQLVERLTVSGRQVIQVRKGDAFNILNKEVLEAGSNDWEAVWKHIRSLGLAISHIVFCATVEEEAGEASYKDIEKTLNDGYIGLCKLAGSLAGVKQEDKINLTVISNNAVQVVDEDRVNPLKACLNAPAKIIPLELLHVTCKVVDIPYPFYKAADEGRYINAIINELDYEASDAVIAYRYFQRWVPSYSLLADDSRLKSGVGIEKTGVYIIAGGFGGMGLTIARNLLTEHNATVILLHRSFFTAKKDWQTWLEENGPEGEISKKITELFDWEIGGGTVDVYQANVGIEKEVQAFFNYAKSKYNRIHGIVWAAGEVDFGGIIQNRNDREFLSYITSKVDGILLFSKYFDFAAVDFLALFSSVGNVFYETKFGQVAYNAANEFMESFSHYARRKWGIHAFTINWCDWLNVGMTVKAEMRRTAGADIRSVNARIEDGIYPAEGVVAFHKCLQSKVIATVIYKGNLSEAIRSGKAKYRSLLAKMQVAANDNENGVSTSLTKEEQLLQLFQVFFGKKSISPADDFFALGGDSLKAMTFVARINQSIGCSLMIADLYRHPTAGELAACLEGVSSATITHIQPAEVKDHYVLSAAQKRMYFIQQLNKSSIAYNEFQLLQLTGKPDVDKIAKTFTRLIERHESLRTSFMLTDNGPVQLVHNTFDFNIEQYDAGNDVTVDELISKFIRPFDLEQVPLLRAGLITFSPQEHILLVDMHHIVADGVSRKILIGDFMALYNGLKLPPLLLQYKDYAEWQQSPAQQERIAIQRSFWLSEFSGELTTLDLPTDFARPTIKRNEGNYCNFSFTPLQTAMLRNVAGAEGASMFMVLMAVYNIMLSRLSNQQDIVIGIPTAGRRHTDVEGIIGMFVNTLPIRCHINSSMTFADVTAAIKSKMLMALENQEYQYEDLIDELKLARDTSRNPLFDVLLSYQQYEDGELQLPQLKIASYNTGPRFAKFDLSLVVWDVAEELHLAFEYSTSLFMHETILRFAEYMVRIVNAVTNNSGCRISDIDILTEPEKRILLHDFNSTGIAYPKNKTITALFEEQAARTPDNVAVLYEEGSITYRQLQEQSDKIAFYLRARGLKTGDLVGVMMERNKYLIPSIFGILKAGGAYVPIDPLYPEARVEAIIQDAGLQVVLTTTPNVQRAALTTVNTITDLCAEWESIQANNDRLAASYADARGLAYVIYTSGSTGKPKGVIIEHHSVLNRIGWMQKEYPLNATDVLLQKTPVVFDVSVWELFWWSFTGASLCLLKPNAEKEPEEIINTIEKNKITNIHFVPSMLAGFLAGIDEGFDYSRVDSLQRVFVSGEALKREHVNAFESTLHRNVSARLINLYGPTEATVDVSYYECDFSNPGNVIPIGKPIDNICLYILGSDNLLLPVGAKGELCIAGVGLARGYLNNSRLTDEKFIHLPWLNGERVYRTGDLARWLPDGNIEYCGRIDDQVKIRGYRIEIKEIMQQLAKHPMIRESAVVAKEKDGNKYLVAYYVSMQPLEFTALKDFLLKELPEYMVPSFFVPLKQLPLSSNGKLDYKALPEPAIIDSALYQEPVGEFEEKLVEIWAGVLKIDKKKISVNVNFFDMGGDSIKVLLLVASINKTLQVKISATDIFRFPSISSLSSLLQKSESDKEMEKMQIENELFEMGEAINILNNN